MWRTIGRTGFYGVVAAAWTLASCAWAVDPNPLQSAYWRFEEGTEFQKVTPRNADVVVDSINNNRMRAFMNETVDAAPTFTSIVPPKPLKSGLPNTLALDFIPNTDIYADTQDINNGVIKRGGGFTVEAAFKALNPNRYGAIVGKEGAPSGNTPTGTGLPTFAIKTTGPGDASPSHLRVQQYDAAKNLVQVTSLAPVNPGQWYYVAAVNDGTQLSLWLDSGSGYELQGTTPVDGALYQGPKLAGDFNGDTIVDAADYVWWRANDSGNTAAYDTWRADFGKKNDWLYNWTIGRAAFNSVPNDFFDGIIDEVRLSNTALSPTEFLFAPTAVGAVSGGSVPEPGSFVLIVLGCIGVGIGRRRDRHC